MSSAIGGIGGNSSMTMQGMGRMQRQDPSKMAEDLFSKLDTSGKGYIEKSDLQTAFQNVPASSSTSAEDVFASLDGDSNGKVTQQEMSDSIKKLTDALDSQLQSMRMSGGMGGTGGMGMQGGADDAGLTQADLTSQLSAIGNPDSNRANMLSSLLDNFDQVDSNSDGKVNREEAQAYKQSSQSTAATTNTSSEAQVLMQIMNLAQAYGFGGSNASGASLSVTA
ncbi:MAG: EF-hand domain-containing protein [Polaromonas sp.]|uniref:EF-hand domain-containing protein n=1 Tax=Polaromonas sp. TaxID=1869339 RepID=UPI0027335013|nr:EF-hand domain-containing protein [Polaromonas sp.]MDP2820365.1 EF-hand domain-containing protein [Polaromonas sp.]